MHVFCHRLWESRRWGEMVSLWRYITHMEEISQIYKGNYEDSKETALVAYAYYRADDYGLRVIENYYEDDGGSYDGIHILWEGVDKPFNY